MIISESSHDYHVSIDSWALGCKHWDCALGHHMTHVSSETAVSIGMSHGRSCD